MSLEPDRRTWQDLALVDPFWAVLSYPEHRFGRWDPAEFFATGEAEVDRLLSRAAPFGYPRRRGAALDFGCGLGRLAPAISRRFGSYCGVDISESMVAQAEHLHSSAANCRFVASADQSLDVLGDSAFDLVVSVLVLQHVPVASTRAYLRSLVRVLEPGGLLVFQLPEHIPRAEQLIYGGRGAAYRWLRRAGVAPGVLHRRLRLCQMAMNFVPETEVVAAVRDSGATVVHLERRRGGMAIGDRVYYVTRAD